MEFGSGNAEGGKKTKSEFGSQELKHSVERTDVRGKRDLNAEVEMRNEEKVGRSHTI
jgi:hypothetical protein